MKIIFPEMSNNSIVQEAIKHFPDIEFFGADNLVTATAILKQGQADSLISGIDFPSRDVVLAVKNQIPLKSKYFSSCFICERVESNGKTTHLAIADGGINKQPDADKLYTIVEDTAHTFEDFYHEQPKIAMLSYSTYGSGGKNPDLEKIYAVIDQIKQNHPDWLIDGEMQLDAAVSPAVAIKKTPGGPLKGQANILIIPDLNSGNIFYKSLERFGGFTIAGPIIQGFTIPLADLSRGSTVEDIILTIKVIRSQLIK